MIATWMFGATLFSVLLAVAAFALERVLRLSQRATRAPWVGALVLALVWPIAAPFVLDRMNKVEYSVTTDAIVAEPTSPATIVARQLPDVSTSWTDTFGTALLIGWIVLSSAMLLRIALASIALSRITRRSHRVELDGASVLVTESLGPAVFGLLRPRVAVPDWFLTLDAPLRKLVLQHELEHCRSRDPQLVWLASLSVALMPWNAAVWYLSRRLRLALEIDCDARTLLREKSTERYGKLLLLIAQRQSGYPLVSMLAESSSHLSQRITAMNEKPQRRIAVRVALFAGIATAAIAVACSPRVASDLTGPNGRPQTALALKSEAEHKAPGTVYFESQVERPVVSAPGSSGPKYPANLKEQGLEGRVMAMFVVDTNGRADINTLKILRTSHPSFTEAVKVALPEMKFLAAEIGGRKVKQLVQVPMEFELGGDGIKGDVEREELRPTGVPSGVNVLRPWRTTVLAPGTKNGSSASPSRNNSQTSGQASGGTVTTDGPRTVDVSQRTTERTPPNVVQHGIYFESQVEVPVKAAAGSKGVVYPDTLKRQGIEGVVLVQFVVDENGVLDQASFRVLKSDHKLLEEAVRAAMPELRFTAATVGGRGVKQLVQQPFMFSLSR